jgi:hypothetical protein
MSSIEDMANNNIPGGAADTPPIEGTPQKTITMPQIDLSFLQAETGAGELDQYINHVLNFNKSKSMAHIIRGLTGIFGNLNKGIIDVLLGVLQHFNNKKNGGVNDN